MNFCSILPCCLHGYLYLYVIILKAATQNKHDAISLPFLQILNYTGLCKSDKGKIHPLFQTEMSYPSVFRQTFSSSSSKTDSSSFSLPLVTWQIISYTAGEDKWHYCSLKIQTGTGLLWGSKEVKGGKEQNRSYF